MEEQSVKIHRGNVVCTITEAELIHIFTPFGKVLTVQIIFDQFARQSKNMGYGEILVREEGKRAIATLNSMELNNNCLFVREA